jgi:FkbM family methyltransferase
MKVRFLLPGTSPTYHCGGLTVSLQIADAIRDLCELEIVTYKEREQNHAFFADLQLEPAESDDTQWIITWGPHVSELLKTLRGRRVLYYAQSAGWHIEMPDGVSIACVSRFVMAYWSQWAPRNALYLLPPALAPECRNRALKRDIDILYMSRKTTPYLHDQLIPALRQHVRVETIEQPAPHGDVLELFNRSRGYVYDFSPTSDRLWVDGFGLQPLEAIVCGATLFATISGGPTDYLNPGRNCVQIGLGREHDLAAIRSVLSGSLIKPEESEALRAQYSVAAQKEAAASLIRAISTSTVRVGRTPMGHEVPESNPDVPQRWRTTLAKQEQEIAVLAGYVSDQDRLIAGQREGIEWLRKELDQREAIIAARDQAIEWLRGELTGAGDRKRVPPPPNRSRPAFVHSLYLRALARYRIAGESSTYKRMFEFATRTVVAVLRRFRGVRFPSRAIGGFWSIHRWRLEFLMGWNEFESVAAVRSLIRPGMTVVDVGAHLGYYTGLLARLVGSSGTVLAFEPEGENFDLLRRNTKRFRSRIKMFNRAISDRTGQFTLHLSPGHSNHSLVAGYTDENGVAIVDTMTMDDALRENGITSVDFIKIDVEGGEPGVIAGMTNTLANSPGLAMLIEYNPRALRCGGTEPEQFVQSLRRLGFAVYAGHASGEWGAVPSDVGIDAINLLCLRDSPTNPVR